MKEITIDEAKLQISSYKYAYLQMNSEHILTAINEALSIDWDELVEGYVFDEKSQLHIYRDEDELKAIVVEDIADASVVDKKYALAGKYRASGRNVIIREYLKADEDGQLYVAATRLAGIE